MNREDLQKMIDELKATNAEENACLGHYPDHRYDTSLDIHANKEGLQLYAAELLKLSLELDAPGIVADPYTKYTIDADWMNGEYHVLNVAYADKEEIAKFEEPVVLTFKDRAIQWGCGLFLIFLLACLVVGFITIVS